MNNLRPYITEKTVNLAKTGKFTLIVEQSATKASVASSVREIFKVKPLSINIIREKSINKRRMRTISIDRGLKKAIVRLGKEDKIPGFEIAKDSGESKEAKKPATKKENKKSA